MTHEEETQSMKNIASVRLLAIKLAAECAKHGASLEDIAIAQTYALIDLATEHRRNPHDAIEWVRTALDVHERALLEQARARH